MAKSNEQVARSWAAVTIKKFRANLDRDKIGRGGNLRRSFEAFVQAEAGGDSVKIKLLYAHYGKFVDMGVGRGSKLGRAKTSTTGQRLKGRRPKKWYSKTIAAETFILGQILQNNTGTRAAATFKELPGNLTLDM